MDNPGTLATLGPHDTGRKDKQTQKTKKNRNTNPTKIRERTWKGFPVNMSPMITPGTYCILTATEYCTLKILDIQCPTRPKGEVPIYIRSNYQASLCSRPVGKSILDVYGYI